MYLALVVFPVYQHKKIGTEIVKSLINGATGLNFSKIIVSVDKENIASLNLFRNVGFVQRGSEDVLIEFEYYILLKYL